MILVTGATGNVGGELVRALAGAGQPVRALTRDDNPREFPAGVQQAPGDLNKPDSMRTALSGTTAVFLYPGYQDTAGTLAEARRAGVRRVVMLSGSSAASGDTGNAVSRYMIESEATVRASGLAWTIVRSFGFMSNTLQWVPQLAAGDLVRAGDERQHARGVRGRVLRLLHHRHAGPVAAPAGRPRRYRPEPAHVPPMGRRPRERLQPVIPVSAVLRKRALGRVFP